jgi:TfoX/Sxy family transcriptional regulator of competence genes
MTIVQRIMDHPALRPAVAKKMFGGTCFMLNGNMAIGTFRDGILVRVGKDAHAKALTLPGASTMVMNGRKMEGYVMVSSDELLTDKSLATWIDLALAFNKTLPAKAAKPLTKKAKG